ncbi:hypothetical protein D9611_013861 [Ephemerocybe angulata]|uniref:pyranose dehydrogenase (acceptor) n=1 Tax=Ephemerocybe angulata TaxID=980116 RepID=A0A8H5BVA5_9AGAR|nr:hypothetical protein D9611_013861 [Tulosesus angulatus]
MLHRLGLATIWVVAPAILPARGIISDTWLPEYAETLYDFVVAGANAGAVVANRLSENPEWYVLLIEAGPTHEGVFDTRVPGLLAKLQGSRYDWNYTTVPQTGFNNRSIKFPRGHILGGCSSIDGLFYTRGSSSDYDRWAEVTGDSGWSWKNILPYFLKNEKWTKPADGHDPVGEYDPTYHSTKGVTYVSSYNSPQVIDSKVIAASRELGGEFTYNTDINDGEELGIGWSHSTIGNGERSSAATSYLTPKVLSRQNLHVLTDHQVTHVLRTSSRGGMPSYRTIRFTPRKTPDDPYVEINVKKEIILSAGVVGTTQILLQSGIGNATELSELGIKPVVDLPSVGKNMSEQAIFFSTYNLGIPGTIEAATPEMQTEWLNEWNTTKTGPLTSIGVNLIGWLRIPDNSSVWEEYQDPASGKNTPHIEIGFDGGSFQTTPRSTIANAIIPLQPESRGSITLRSSDPFDHPNIDFGFFNSKLDLITIREGVRQIHRLYSAPAFAEYNLSLPESFPPLDDDNALEEYIRNNADHAAHPVGTAAMSPRDADWGVVDPDLLLKTVSGLRIVDASVMPFIPAGHTQAPVYAIAERAADIIKEAWEWYG